MLEATLDWRRDFRPDALSYSTQAAEAERGKVYVLERPCRAGRPVVFMRPARDEFARGEDDTERLRWVVYVLEQGSRLADAAAPDGKMTWLIDFVGYSRRNAAPMGTSMRTLSILQASSAASLSCQSKQKTAKTNQPTNQPTTQSLTDNSPK